MDKKTIKREGKKAIKIVKESEKRQGIIGYKIYVTDKNSYLAPFPLETQQNRGGLCRL
ncbi:hypothetical protein [Serratia nevei]|uniref:hypothetical protein n=1 Tax=Serratia nevei TaxID=2703794 RepID=UPI003F777DAB